MGRSRAVASLMVALLLVFAGCSREVAGTAQIDPQQPPLTLAKDGYGIVAGFEDAPKRIEIFTEPQCNHCADLQADFGDQLAYYIGVGQLKVTYRPLTFLDHQAGGYSARVSNALFTAAEPNASGEHATGTQFQRFVEELWGHQNPGGPGPTDDEMADMARKVGMPEDVAKRIAEGKPAVDIGEMDSANFEYLFEIDPLSTGTPTVYNPATDEKLDIYDDNWLTKLMQP